MAKSYYKCAKCKAEILVIGRNTADADSLAKWHAAKGHICDICTKEERLNEAKKAAETAHEAGLPDLQGSEKQVAWAQTLRQSLIADLEKAQVLVMAAFNMIDEKGEIDKEKAKKTKEELGPLSLEFSSYWFNELFNALGNIEKFQAFYNLVKTQSSAKFWIDHRDLGLYRLYKIFSAEIESTLAKTMTADPLLEINAKAEALLKPDSPKSPMPAEIRVVGDAIKIVFQEKNDAFREIVKTLGYTWDGKAWSKSISFKTGPAEDRVAEAGHRLVEGGFIVQINDLNAHEKARTGQFKEEQTRWITKGTTAPYEGWCCITWRKPDDLYAAARSLPGARYHKGAVYVPQGAIEAVAEFAEEYGFDLSDTPKAILQAHREAMAQGATVSGLKDRPAPVRAESSSKPVRLTPPQNSTIDADLKDE